MDLRQFKRLLRMEWMKACCRLNFVFSSMAFALVLVQVAFLVRLDLGDAAESYSAAVVQDYAARYIRNLACTFIPLLLLVNIAREFDHAVVHRSLVSGISRRVYFYGKLIQLVIFALFAFLLAIVFVQLVAMIYELPFELNPGRMLMYFVVSCCLGSLALMIALIWKKRSYALAVFIAYGLLENTISLLAADRRILLPFQACIRLLRYGIYQPPELVMATVYTVTFLAMGWLAFRRSDLR